MSWKRRTYRFLPGLEHKMCAYAVSVTPGQILYCIRSDPLKCWLVDCGDWQSNSSTPPTMTVLPKNVWGNEMYVCVFEHKLSSVHLQKKVRGKLSSLYYLFILFRHTPIHFPSAELQFTDRSDIITPSLSHFPFILHLETVCAFSVFLHLSVFS